MCKKNFGSKYQLSSQEKIEILNKKNNYENTRSSLIEALKIIQKYRGWISRESMYAISNLLKISESDVEEVATFYSQIFRQRVGRNIIRYCDSVVCYIAGYEKIKRVLETTLNVQIGNTTSDFRFTLLPVCCLGNCDKAPAIMINDDIYSNVKPEIVINLLELYQ